MARTETLDYAASGALQKGLLGTLMGAVSGAAVGAVALAGALWFVTVPALITAVALSGGGAAGAEAAASGWTATASTIANYTLLGVGLAGAIPGALTGGAIGAGAGAGLGAWTGAQRGAEIGRMRDMGLGAGKEKIQETINNLATQRAMGAVQYYSAATYKQGYMEGGQQGFAAGVQQTQAYYTSLIEKQRAAQGKPAMPEDLAPKGKEGILSAGASANAVEMAENAPKAGENKLPG